MCWNSGVLVAALSTGHKAGLVVVAVLFILFALVSSLVVPRRRPDFPGPAGLSVFVIASLTVFAATIAAIAIFGAESPSGPAKAAPAKTVRVSTRTLPKLGNVLVDSRGRTLYIFLHDKRKKVTCLGACAAIWPPLKLATGARPTAAGEAQSSLLGSDPNPAGGRVVSYAGWPLYLYAGDHSPGSANGQALNLNGGLWYVLTPAGKAIQTKP
jgi:predicted lipoprotein with Yx(FWY)xxD motif